MIATALLAGASAAQAKPSGISHAVPWEVCFTPGQDCTGLIVESIDGARIEILMQAYSFTSAPIAEALVRAKKRGVDVRAILDKSQRAERYTGATFLGNAGIPVLIDERPAIAHNKVMVLDGSTVITGSFNFTKAAQEKNAENVLILRDEALAHRYGDNWRSRAKVSVAYAPR